MSVDAMLQSVNVNIPTRVEARLKRAINFVDPLMDFARDDLIGFRRPLAATFAWTAPIVIALIFHTAGLEPTIRVAASYISVAFAGLYLVGREEWPGLVDRYEARQVEKRRAEADLKCGYSQASCLRLTRAPRFIEYDHGVLALADAGDLRTLFMSIAKDDADPRWALYCEGELTRSVWRWLRLPVSRELLKFGVLGERAKGARAPWRITSIEEWEAVNVALGEPLDGAIIHRPLDEIEDIVSRLL